MGVKHFYMWYKKHFSPCVSKIPPDRVDCLALDLNGLFHLCAQTVFRYGTTRYLLEQKTTITSKNHQVLFREVCEKINRLRAEIRPLKRIVLCVDGVAGLAKMNQQRQRRFRSGITRDPGAFDPNSFTPGTRLMDHLTKYIDWYLRLCMTTDPEWQGLEVILSNEKVPGEGEHKIMRYIRSCPVGEVFCIYGLDADLVMISSLLPSHHHLYIAREFDYGTVEYVDIRLFTGFILECLYWGSTHGTRSEEFSRERALQDFVLMSTLVGNDFLPSIPTLTILDGAMDIMLETYRSLGRHLCMIEENPGGRVEILLDSLGVFFERLSVHEHPMIEKKYNSQYAFFPDPLVLQNLYLENQKNIVHFTKYRQDYYKEKFEKGTFIPDVVHHYLDGIRFVLNYYKYGMPDWSWHYPYFYAPFLVDFPRAIESYHHPHSFTVGEPAPPFLQLLMVLPESSFSLLPQCFQGAVDTGLKPFFPESIEIDLTGKRKEWEGIVLLPMIQVSRFRSFYEKKLAHLLPSEIKRNIIGKTFVYSYHPTKRFHFSSFYGNILDCPILTSVLHLP